jgi:hypothetical protein
MGLIWCDGFNSYTSTSDLSNVWTATGAWAWGSSTGRLSDGGISCAAGTAATITSPINIWSFPNSTYGGFCFWVKISAAPNTTTTFFTSGSGTLSVTSGGLVISAGSGNSTTPSICDNAWHWIEYRNNNTNVASGGASVLWIDGISYGGTAPGLGTSSSIVFSNLAANGTISVSYLFVIDNNSPAPQTSGMPIGQRQISLKRATSDSSVQFSRSSGSTNYSLINESSPDGDASYVQDGTSGQADTYNYAALGFVPNTITGVQIASRVKNAGAGAVNFKNRCISNGTTSDGASTVSPANYQNFYSPYSQDPHTSAAWTQSNLDNATFGIAVS